MTDKIWHDFLIIWATIDPIGTMALFAGLTAKLTPAQRRKTAFKTIAYAAIILVGALVIGQILLGAMGISLLSFQVAGGVILFLFGLQMIFSEGFSEATGEPRHDISVFPLAVPATASPGAILAVILITDNKVYTIEEQAITAATLFVVLLVAAAIYNRDWVLGLGRDPAGELRSAFYNSSVIVTGASYGIGAEIALALCEKAEVRQLLITARSMGKLEKVKRECERIGSGRTEVIVHAADLGTMEGSASVIDRAVEVFKDGVIDTLVLNHVISTYGDWSARLIQANKQEMEDTLELVTRMFNTNTLSYISLSSYALTSLMKAARPQILVVGSLAGKLGLPRVAPYSSTKFASLGYFESLRQPGRLRRRSARAPPGRRSSRRARSSSRRRRRV